MKINMSSPSTPYIQKQAGIEKLESRTDSGQVKREIVRNIAFSLATQVKLTEGGLEVTFQNLQDSVDLIMTAKTGLQSIISLLEHGKIINEQDPTGFESSKFMNEWNRIIEQTTFQGMSLLDEYADFTTMKLILSANGKKFIQLKLMNATPEAFGMNSHTPAQGVLSTFDSAIQMITVHLAELEVLLQQVQKQLDPHAFSVVEEAMSLTKLRAAAEAGMTMLGQFIPDSLKTGKRSFLLITGAICIIFALTYAFITRG
ncbi:hypothetical protein ACFDTO_15600 [Microbacteriaceae bacterium 4G12]